MKVSAASHEKLNGACPVEENRGVQGRVAFVIGLVDCRSPVAKQPRDELVPLLSSRKQGRVAELSILTDVDHLKVGV